MDGLLGQVAARALGGEAWYVIAMVAALGAVLWWRLPQAERGSVYGTLVLWAAAFATQWAAALVAELGYERSGAIMREVAMVAGGLAIIRLWGFTVFRVILPLLRLEPTRFLEDVVVTLAYLGWFFVRLRFAGLDLGSLVATSAVITAVIAFSMQDTLGNVLGGLALQADRSIAVGDWIKLDDLSGRVVQIGWRSTLIETRNWETVVVPNSVLMKNRFAVLGRRTGQPQQWRRWIWFNIGYEHPPSRVIEVAERSVAEAEINNVARLPLPSCVLMDFEPSSGRYALRYWLTNLEADDPTDTRVRVHVLAALQRAGIRIAVPEYNIHTVSEDEAHRSAVRGREMERRLAALHAVDVFRSLTEAELLRAAEGLTYSPFAAGDVITRQGADAHWLYLLVAGEAEVFVEHDDDSTRTPIGVIMPPAFFGEMSLLTGEPRTATVTARTDCECYRLDKATFGAILKGRPALAEQIAPVLEQRRRSRELALASRGVATSAAAGEDLLSKVRRFFGL
jgi:small-conductance mechanosensitive channel/CRP-like cAMP-binding protein